MSKPALMLVFLTIALTAAGQALVKHGVLEVGASPGQFRQLPAFLGRALTNPSVVLGLTCAVFAALAWIMALSRTELSRAYPFMGLTFGVVLLLSALLFGERVPATRWLGVLVICLGIWLSAR